MKTIKTCKLYLNPGIKECKFCQYDCEVRVKPIEWVKKLVKHIKNYKKEYHYDYCPKCKTKTGYWEGDKTYIEIPHKCKPKQSKKIEVEDNSYIWLTRLMNGKLEVSGYVFDGFTIEKKQTKKFYLIPKEKSQ
jgi:hypothetical protein